MKSEEPIRFSEKVTVVEYEIGDEGEELREIKEVITTKNLIK